MCVFVPWWMQANTKKSLSIYSLPFGSVVNVKAAKKNPTRHVNGLAGSRVDPEFRYGTR
jgi:hypothetical protein